jgi:tRNA pseudouridine55 synthase
MVGRATRLARFIALLPKRYAGTIALGSETTSDDAAGAIVGERDDSWEARLPPEIDAALRNVQARTQQMPPAVSAKKVDGVRAYRLARRGETPALTPAKVTIERLRCEWFDRPAGEIHVDVVCSSGTYVRSIARDVGRELGSKAHLLALRRTEIGHWKVEQAVKLESVEPSAFSLQLLPMREAVSHLPAVILPAEEAKRFSLGQKIPAAAPVGPVAVFDVTDLLGVAQLSDGVLHPEVVLVG